MQALFTFCWTTKKTNIFFINLYQKQNLHILGDYVFDMPNICKVKQKRMAIILRMKSCHYHNVLATLSLTLMNHLNRMLIESLLHGLSALTHRHSVLSYLQCLERSIRILKNLNIIHVSFFRYYNQAL